jgi:hypothetical protein
MANQARDMARDGMVDAGLKLLYDARFFVPRDAEAPDTMRIAIDDTLNIASRSTRQRIDAGSEVVLSRQGEFIHSRRSGMLALLRSDGGLIEVKQKSPDPASIIAIEKAVDGGYDVLRADGRLEYLDLLTGSWTLVHQFAYDETDDWPDPTGAILPGGIVQFSMGGPASEIFDPATGYVMATPAEDVWNKLIEVGGKPAVVDLFSGTVKRLDTATGRLVAVDDTTASGLALGEYCFGRTGSLPIDIGAIMVERLEQGLGYDRFACRSADGAAVIEQSYNTSDGTATRLTLGVPGHPEVDLLAALAAYTGMRQDVEFQSTSRAVQFDVSTGRIAIALGRDIFVGTLDPHDDEDGYMLEFKDSFKVGYPPSALQLLDNDRLAIIDGVNGLIDVRDTGYLPIALRDSAWDLPPQDPDGDIDDNGNVRPRPYHKGTCTDVAFSRLVDLPDGRKLQIFEAGYPMDDVDAIQTSYIRVISDGGKQDIEVPEGGCFSLSHDFRKLALIDARGNVVIYDFEQALLSGKLADPHSTGLRSNEVFFVGDDIVTSDDSGSVWRWDETLDENWIGQELYRGDGWISHAEPDADASHLIIVEAKADQEDYAFTYSVRSRMRWHDLGHAYKFLAASWTEDMLPASNVLQGDNTGLSPIGIVKPMTLDDQFREASALTSRFCNEGDGDATCEQLSGILMIDGVAVNR